MFKTVNSRLYFKVIIMRQNGICIITRAVKLISPRPSCDNLYLYIIDYEYAIFTI